MTASISGSFLEHSCLLWSCLLPSRWLSLTGSWLHYLTCVNTLRPVQNGSQLAGDIIKYILQKENLFMWIRSGVTLCFQFVFTAASTAAKTFAYYVKTICAKPYIFWANNIWVWGNVLDDLSMTLTQGHSCDIDLQKFVCLHDKERTTHPITTKLGSFIPPQKKLDVFFQGQTLFWAYLRNGWCDWCETKRKCIGWILGILCDLDLWPHSDLDLDFSRSNFE